MLPVDLNTSPASSIKRVEILRDGASAQYGSDAIAGVINIVLRDDASGGAGSPQYGITGNGDGPTWYTNLTIGFSPNGSPPGQERVDPVDQYPVGATSLTNTEKTDNKK